MDIYTKHSHFSRFSKLYVSLGLLIFLGACLWGNIELNNQMVMLEQRATTQWQQVNTQLARQYELIPKLVDIAKSYAAHEREVFSSVAAASQRYQSSTANEQPVAAGELDAAMAGLFVIVERYPNLKADSSFRDVSYELAGTKNRIATERMRYNESVGLYNARLKQFPWRLISTERSALPYYTLPDDQLVEPEWTLR